MRVPTVKIKHSSGDYAVINESDFNPDLHELYEEPKAKGGKKGSKKGSSKKEAAEAAPEAAAPEAESADADVPGDAAGPSAA